MLNFIKNIIAPKKCYSCGEEWHFLCLKCMSKMSDFNSICYICKRKTIKFEVHQKCQQWIYYNSLIIVTHYNQHPIKKLIKDFKFYYKKDIAQDIAYYMIKKLKENIDLSWDNYLIITTPLYFLRKWKRWYNQTEILSKYIITKINNISIEKNLVKRVRNTRQQSTLSKNQRLSNLEKAFKINKKLVDKIDKNKTIIIVDDVISTGATINSIAKLLKENWFKKIIWLVFASD